MPRSRPEIDALAAAAHAHRAWRCFLPAAPSPRAPADPPRADDTPDWLAEARPLTDTPSPTPFPPDLSPAGSFDDLDHDPEAALWEAVLGLGLWHLIGLVAPDAPAAKTPAARPCLTRWPLQPAVAVFTERARAERYARETGLVLTDDNADPARNALNAGVVLIRQRPRSAVNHLINTVPGAAEGHAGVVFNPLPEGNHERPTVFAAPLLWLRQQLAERAAAEDAAAGPSRSSVRRVSAKP